MARRDELDRRRARLTPRQQAMLARRLQGEAPERPAALPLAPREEEGPAPLSFAQERFWFIEQMTPGTPGAILTRAYRMEGPLEAGLLAEALTATVARHALLRTVYRVEAGRVVQVPLPPVPVPLPLEDLRGARSPEEAVRARAQAESQVPFDLAGEPPVRFRLYRTGEQEHVLLAVLHHIAFDGWSVRVLMEELAAAYDGLAAGKTAYREPLPVQYADYAVWQRAQVEQNGQVHLDYWRRRLHRGVAAGYRVLGQPIPEAFRLAYVMEAYRRLMRAYDPPRYPGRLTVVRSSRLRDLPPDLGWSSRADEVAAFDIDGPHRLLDEPYVADLAAILVRCRAEAEAERGG